MNYEMAKRFINFVKNCAVSLHKSYRYQWDFCIQDQSCCKLKNYQLEANRKPMWL